MKRFRTWLWEGTKDVLQVLALLAWVVFSLCVTALAAYPLRHHHAFYIEFSVWLFVVVGISGISMVNAVQDRRSNRYGTVQEWRLYYGLVFVAIILWPLVFGIFFGLLAIVIGLMVVVLAILLVIICICIALIPVLLVSAIVLGVLWLFGFRPEFLSRKFDSEGV